jgi:hypothetical protein
MDAFHAGELFALSDGIRVTIGCSVEKAKAINNQWGAV